MQIIICNVLCAAVYGKPLVCTYDGAYYCTDCHHNDEFYIPSRIIFNWDFSKHKGEANGSFDSFL